MSPLHRSVAGPLIGLAAVLGLVSNGLAASFPPASRSATSQAANVAGLIVKMREVPQRVGVLASRAEVDGPAGRATPTAAQAGAERMRQALAAAGVNAAVHRPVGRTGQLVQFDRPLSMAEASRVAEQMRLQPGVEWVVLNEREHRQQVPSDPYFGATAPSTGQWWLHPVAGSSANALRDRLRGVPGLQSAWVTTTGSALATVAVLDTGITTHPDLSAHVLPGHDFVSELGYANDGDGRDADASDPGDWVSQADKDGNPALFGACDVDTSSWHGTVIAGIVAAVSDNGLGVAGANWNGRVLPVRVAGKCGAEVADIVDGMRWAAGLPVDGAPTNRHPARVINISFGGNAPCNAAYQDAIDELRAVGAVVVAAAGNTHGGVKRPASCAGVIGVAALNRDGFKASYSNFGPAVAVSTVGGDPSGEGLWGSLLGDDGLFTVDNLGLSGPGNPSYGASAGTSFAAPVVAGVVSLMLSVNPNLTAAQLIDGVKRSARPHVVSTQMSACAALNPGRCTCTADTCGAGILDAAQALRYAADPATYVAPAQTAAIVDSRDLSAALAMGSSDQPPNDSGTANASAGDGGGAMNLEWALMLALAVALLARQAAAQRRSGTGRLAVQWAAQLDVLAQGTKPLPSAAALSAIT